MNTLKYTLTFAATGMLLVAAPAFALKVVTDVNAQASVGSGAGVTVGASAQARMTDAIDRADQEITRRITALTDLNAKVAAMTHISATEVASINTEVQNETATLSSLKAKIDADTDMTTLRADIKTIAPDYRIFMLVIPQGRIEVAADHLQTIATAYTTFAGKLQARVNAGQAAGKDVTALSTALADMNAKIADVNLQAQASLSHVGGLQPDNGDKSVMQSNQTALKQGRADIQVALSDIKTARKDADTIVKAIAAWHMDVSASSTISTQAQ